MALAAFATKAGFAGLTYDASGATDVDFLFSDANGDRLYRPAAGDAPRIDLAQIAAVERYGFDVTAGGTTAAREARPSAWRTTPRCESSTSCWPLTQCRGVGCSTIPTTAPDR